MNELIPEEHYALDLIRERHRTSRRHHSPSGRRTTRRALARGLHRLADRVDADGIS
jgi:hypothetical protein